LIENSMVGLPVGQICSSDAVRNYIGKIVGRSDLEFAACAESQLASQIVEGGCHDH